MSPNAAISRLSSLLAKYGPKTVIGKSEFKHEREAWIAAVFLLGLRQFDKNEYWLEIETEESTPDVYGYYLDNVDGNNHRLVCNLEITEWEEHSKNIIEVIKNKSRKNYPSDFYLLVYARKPGESIDYDQLYEEINKSKIPFAQIWTIACFSDDNDYHLTQIHPKKLQFEFNLDAAIGDNKSQTCFATFLMRGKGTKARPLGEIFVPLPKLREPNEK